MKKAVWIAAILILIFSMVLATSTVVGAQEGGSVNDFVDVTIKSSSITWTPKTSDIKGSTLTIAGPNGYYSQKTYGAKVRPSVSSGSFGDGTYAYEIVLWPKNSPDAGDQSLRGLNPQSQEGMKRAGTFTVLRGSFVIAAQEASQTAPKNAPREDNVIADDLVVQGSGCFGFDCINNESFGFDTIRLKENNLRINFDDTSVSAGYPANDWTIVANDSASGGANYLAFQDVTGAKFPFKVSAGAPTNSLFVSSNGDIGVRTSTPVLDFHANTSDTPGLRLEQTNAGGFTAQTWDIAGNEANFFVRDVTGGSLLPFRIRPGAPTSSIDIDADGNVGIGTASPDYDLDVANTGANTLMAVRRTDGATMLIAAGPLQGSIGTITNSALAFNVNNTQKMTLATDGSLTVLGPVNATAFNVTSDKNAKENFAPVDQKSVLDRLANIPISTWNFIANDNKTKHMGPMAQDFYAAFGLGADNKHISTLDADGVAFAAIQELNKRNTALSSENAALRGEVNDLATRVAALEAGNSPAGQASQNWIIVLLVGMNLALIVFVVFSIRRGAFAGIKVNNQ